MVVTWISCNPHTDYSVISKINFTVARVDDFTCPLDKSQTFPWDSKVSGLGLRATSAGAKAYIFQAKFNGLTVRTTIGDVTLPPKNVSLAVRQSDTARSK
jgi:hypothetical protein